MEKLGTDQNPHDVSSLTGLASYVVAVADGALADMSDEARRTFYRHMPHGDLTESERAELSELKGRFARNAEMLSKMLKHPMDREEARATCGHLMRAAVHDAFRLGQLATYNPIVQRWRENQVQSQTKAARDSKPARENVDATIRKCLDKHIATKPNEKNRTPNDLGKSIEEAVNQELSPDGKHHWGSNAIAKRIRKIRTAGQSSA
jgi:hypothetical protein